MHRAFAAWLTAKPWHAPLVMALALVLPLALLVAGAIPVLLLLARSAGAAFNAAVVGGVVLVGATLAAGRPVAFPSALVVLMYFAPLLLATLVQRTGGLRWSYQVAVLGACALVGAMYLGVDDPAARLQDFLRYASAQSPNAGFKINEEVITGPVSGNYWGAFVALCLLLVLGWLFLGCWWHSLLHAPGEFGKEFQRIKLGKTLGTFAVAVVIAVFVLDKFGVSYPALNALVWIATVALACQGLAATHRLKATGRVGSGWLMATYLLLIVPFTTPFVVMLLAGWGVADNWRRPS